MELISPPIWLYWLSFFLPDLVIRVLRQLVREKPVSKLHPLAYCRYDFHRDPVPAMVPVKGRGDDNGARSFYHNCCFMLQYMKNFSEKAKIRHCNKSQKCIFIHINFPLLSQIYIYITHLKLHITKHENSLVSLPISLKGKTKVLQWPASWSLSPLWTPLPLAHTLSLSSLLFSKYIYL